MISDKINYRVIYNRKNHLRNDGTALLQIEARLHGQRSLFSTGIYVSPNQWGANVIINHPNAAGLNAMLWAFKVRLESIEIDLWKRDITPTLIALKEAVRKNRMPEDNFLRWAKMYISENHSGRRRRATIDNLRSTLNKLGAFRPSFSFADLTYSFLIEFESFLTASGSAPNTIIKHMRQLRTLVSEAIRQRYMKADDNPYRNYKMRTMVRRTEFLTPAELRRLEQRKRTKLIDAFLFCCYTGIRFNDFKALRNECVVRDGRDTWLKFTTIKTRTSISLPLNHLFDGKALCLIDGYGSVEALRRVGSNSSCNRKLRILMQEIGIKGKVTWHTSRHTCACNLLHQGVPVTTVQKLLGHNSIRTTMGYVDLMDSTVLGDLKNVKKRRKVTE